MREAFLTRLESSLARRISEQSEVFDSNSAFIRLALRVFFKFIDAGIISLDLVWLKEVLQENQENLRNRIASAMREPVSAPRHPFCDSQSGAAVGIRAERNSPS